MLYHGDVFERLKKVLGTIPPERKIPRLIATVSAEIAAATGIPPHYTLYGNWVDTLVAAVDVSNLANEHFAPNGISMEWLCHIRIENASSRKNWRTPLDNHGNAAMIAFDVDDKALMAKVGKVVSGAYEPSFGHVPSLKPLVIWMASEIASRWVAEHPNNAFRLVVSNVRNAYDYAYKRWPWAENGRPGFSCMATGTPVPTHFPDDFHDVATSNDHMEFYDNIEAASIAMLLDADNCVIARCIVWRVVTPNGEIGYADRAYAMQDAHRRALYRALYDGHYISANKIVGAGCGETLAIEDGKGDRVDASDWYVENVHWNYGDMISYCDTFSQYDMEQKCLFIDAPDDHLNFQTTSMTINRLRCSRCGCDISNEDDAHYDPDGDLMCDDCFFESCNVCMRCGETIWQEDVVNVDGDPYCEHCAEHDCYHCADCGEWFHSGDEGIYYNDEWYCPSCAERFCYCDECGEPCECDDSCNVHGTNGYELTVCRNCCNAHYVECAACGEFYHESVMIDDGDDDSLCPDCAEEVAKARNEAEAPALQTATV